MHPKRCLSLRGGMLRIPTWQSVSVTAFQTVGTGLRRGTFLDRQEKYPKEADSREVLTVKSIALPSMSIPLTSISSRPPLRIPPGRFASVESSIFYSLLSNYNLTHCNEPGKNNRVTIPEIYVRIVSGHCPPNDYLSFLSFKILAFFAKVL